jgi:enamine deaminase RidA (YjgF/YER057c/UK114 family)
MIVFRNPESVHVPVGGYSHQAEVHPGARWLVLAGQVGKTTDGAVPEDGVAQIQVALENIDRNLKAAGMERQDLVKLTWYLLADVDNAKRLEVAERWLSGHEPCSTVLYVAALARPIYRVEIDAWACSESS